jgi:hypothetical protein
MKYDYLSVNSNCNLHWNPLLVALGCVYRAVHVPWFMLFSISRNSKPSQCRSQWQAALDRHGFQRVRILRTAVTTHLVRLTLQCEHTAEVSVVTSKEEIEHGYDGRHKRSFVVLALPA